MGLVLAGDIQVIRSSNAEKKKSYSFSLPLTMQKLAVLHQNKYLFVLFGANSQGSPTDGFYTISLDNNQWVGNPANGDTPASNGGNGGGDSGSSSPGSSLNGGAIAGVIVACLILVYIY